MAKDTEGPIVAYRKGEGEEYEGRTDAIYLEFSIEGDDGLAWFNLPQFGMEVCVPATSELEDMAGEAGRELVQRLLAFYVALTELPPQYITEVEETQRELIERLLLPWLGRILGRRPEYISFPSDAFALDPEGRHLASW